MEQIPASLGHLASRTQLSRLGIGRHRIDAALASGELLPVKPGWVATRHALQPAVLAVLHNARLTSGTALRTLGVWAGEDARIHLQQRPGTHHTTAKSLTPLNLFTPLDAPAGYGGDGIRFHSAPFVQPRPSEADWRVPIADALIRFGKDESDEHVAAALSSAVHLGYLSRAGALAVLGSLPRRVHRIAPALTFLDGSGLETVFRFRVTPMGFRIAQQRQIGVDRVDFVLDEWLIIEVDGDEWHQPRADRARTNRLIRAGYDVLRFGYDDVMHRWNETAAAIRMKLSSRPWGTNMTSNTQERWVARVFV